MADLRKGLWEQNNVANNYTSSDSDTESETEISSSSSFLWVRDVKDNTATTTPCGSGKNGSIETGGGLRGPSRRKRNGEERMPTRRPDPNVLNRNALLARENRRKKKLYLESVENELHDARRANRALVKALKRQVKVTQRLEQEKRYFQNILANQTEISQLVSSFNKRRQLSIDQETTSSMDVLEADLPLREPLTSCCSSSSSYDPEPLQSPFGAAASHDLDTDIGGTGSGGFSSSSWDDIWNTPSNGLPLNENEGENLYPLITTLGKDYQSSSMEDHNYVVTPNENQSSLDMPLLSEPSPPSSSSPVSGDEFQGVCLHLQRGKISLEFCPTCHLNSSSRDPPLQLFNDEMLV